MVVERFPKRRMLNDLDDIDWKIQQWFRHYCERELRFEDRQDKEEAHGKALDLSEIMDAVRNAKSLIRMFEPS